VSLRRTALKRRTELRRATPMPRSKRELACRTLRTIQRRRGTGPSRDVRQVVLDRASGCCELCTRILHDGYEWVDVHSFHHRQPRRMGGTSRPEANSPSNLLLLCGSGVTGCHGRVERDRELATALGWLVPMGQDPSTIPANIAVTTASATKPFILTADGRYEEPA